MPTEKMSKQRWKKIVDDINALIDDPPAGCSAERIDDTYLGAGKAVAWSVKMVRDVQDKLIEICPDNEFDPPHKWSQKMMDAIRDAIDKGWCNCNCCDYILEILCTDGEVLHGSKTATCSGGEETYEEVGEFDAEIISTTFTKDEVVIVSLVAIGDEPPTSSLPPNSLSSENRECLESILAEHHIEIEIPEGI